MKDGAKAFVDATRFMLAVAHARHEFFGSLVYEAILCGDVRLPREVQAGVMPAQRLLLEVAR